MEDNNIERSLLPDIIYHTKVNEKKKNYHVMMNHNLMEY